MDGIWLELTYPYEKKNCVIIPGTIFSVSTLDIRINSRLTPETPYIILVNQNLV
jgi:hypothetical protein